MSFASFADFLHMGGHAAYVWSSYGITAVVMAATLVWPLRRHQKILAELREAARSGELRTTVADQDRERKEHES